MNDIQMKALIDAIEVFSSTVEDGFEKIRSSIENTYTPSNYGIERRLEQLIEALYETH